MLLNAVTVYEKGAEVVRLYRTLLGKEGFRKGMYACSCVRNTYCILCTSWVAPAILLHHAACTRRTLGSSVAQECFG